jgi:ribosomal protein S7
MNDAQTVAELFEHAIELEKSLETLYRQFGGIFADHPEVAKFWKHYADEEKGHAAYLERVRDNAQAGRLSEPADEFMLQKVRKCLAEVSPPVQLKEIRTLDDAYQLAVDLENSETNAIFEFIIVNFSTEELAKSHKFLRVQLSEHVAKLTTHFPSQYMSKAVRKNTSAKNLIR